MAVAKEIHAYYRSIIHCGRYAAAKCNSSAQIQCLTFIQIYSIPGLPGRQRKRGTFWCPFMITGISPDADGGQIKKFMKIILPGVSNDRAYNIVTTIISRFFLSSVVAWFLAHTKSATTVQKVRTSCLSIRYVNIMKIGGVLKLYPERNKTL